MFNPDLSFEGELKFDIGKILPFEEGFYDILNSVFVIKLMALPMVGTFMVTNERFRPDIISYKLYGSEEYKIILMLYNGITSFQEIIPGITLLYPSLKSMEEILFDYTPR